MGYRTLCAMGWLGVVLSLAPDASAQARQQRDGSRRNPYGRTHRLRPQRAPVAGRESGPTGPWTAARSSVIVSAESLAGISYYRLSGSIEESGAQTTRVESGLWINLLKGAQPNHPFAEPRLALDAVIGPGITLGGSIGYSTRSGDATTTQTLRGFEPQTQDDSLATESVFVFVPRFGYLIAPSRYVGVWLRAGVGYAAVSAKDTDDAFDVTQTSVDIMVDPMLVITPLAHVGFLIGPQLNIGVGGSTSGSVGGESAPDNSMRRSAYGVSAGIALLL
jgi:hypothetical protein